MTVDIESKIASFELSVKLELPVALTVISGPSGSGKSSLLNCISGLKTPDKGRIVLGNKVFFDSVASTNTAVQKRNCGYVLQNLALFPHMNVAGNICFGIEKLSAAQQQTRLNELLCLMKLEGMQNRKVCELSGGQAQRVALARALAPVPSLLLLDEPFSALDPDLRSELGSDLKVTQKQLGIPVLLVTHQKSEAALLADVLVNIDGGKVVSVQDSKNWLSAGAASMIESDSMLSW